MVIGKRLRYYRKEANMTQKQLSEAICAITYLSKVENGKMEASEEILKLLCERLGITLEQLTEDEDSAIKALLYQWDREIKFRNYDGAEKLYQDLKLRFEKRTDPFLLTHYTLMYFRYLLFCKKYTEAKKVLSKLKQMIEYMSRDLTFYFHKFIGLYEYLNGNLNSALEHYKSAERTAKELNISEPIFLYQRALVHSVRNELSLSNIYVYQALQVFLEEVDYERCTECFMLFAINLSRAGDHDLAEKYFVKVLNSSEFHRNAKSIKGKAHHNIGTIHFEKGQYAIAIKHLEKALDLKTSPHDKTSTYTLLAEIYYTVDKKERAQDWLLEGLNHIQAHPDPGNEIKLKVLQFQVLNQEHSEEFKDYIKDVGLPYFKGKGDGLACHYAELLGNLYATKLQYKKSSHYYRLANELRKIYKC